MWMQSGCAQFHWTAESPVKRFGHMIVAPTKNEITIFHIILIMWDSLLTLITQRDKTLRHVCRALPRVGLQA